MSSKNFDHLEVLEAAFADPNNSAATFAPEDVNKVMANAYTIDRPHLYTRSEMWDMEIRKASHPDKYLAGLVRPGSLERFPSTRNDDEIEEFTRITDQIPWKGGPYSTVIEHVRIYKKDRRAIFIGADEFVTPDGRKIVGGKVQPLFHVEHSTIGTEEQPLNVWRVVSLTGGEDKAFVAALGQLEKSPYLQIFHEVYLREDIGLKLERKASSSSE